MFLLGDIKELLKKINNLDEKMHKNAEQTDKRLDSIEKVLIVQEQNLKEHMKRSDSLETIIDHLKEKDVKPLTKHVNMVEGALKLVGILSVIVSLIGGIIKLFGFV